MYLDHDVLLNVICLELYLLKCTCTCYVAHLCCCASRAKTPMKGDGVGWMEIGEEYESPDGGEQGERAEGEVLCGQHC